MIAAASKTLIGPRHHGRKMSLRAFEFAQVEEGYLYELARGYIVVSEVANYPHAMRTSFVRTELGAYQREHRDRVHAVLDGSQCKLLIPAWESERHPDVAVYLAAPKGQQDRTLWRRWVPEIVIEVVSESSRDRDYTEKRDEYWTLGVKEYWIVDAKLEQVLLLKRGKSQWIEKTLEPADFCESKLLPGFKLSCGEIFAVAAEDEGQ